MSHILDRFATSSHFSPQTAREFFALQLARKLGDEPTARHYAMLTDVHGEERLLAVFRRALRDCAEQREIAARFHVELEGSARNGHQTPVVRLAAFRIERRSIAVAVFLGEHLDYTQVRHLSSTRDKAGGSAVVFVRWILQGFRIQSTALETIPNGHEIQRAALAEAVRDVFRDAGLPVWEVAKQDLFAAFGFPPLRSRRELREVVACIWPVLDGGTGAPMILDAVALGLYVQTERLFLN
jgi:hypothetical protein